MDAFLHCLQALRLAAAVFASGDPPVQLLDSGLRLAGRLEVVVAGHDLLVAVDGRHRVYDAVVEADDLSGSIRALERRLGLPAPDVDLERALFGLQLVLQPYRGRPFEDDARPDVDVFGDVLLRADVADPGHMQRPAVDAADFLVDPAAVAAG